MATWELAVDWANDGAFTGDDLITGDAIAIECWRGRDYASQVAGRSKAGRLVAQLRNDDGKYSPFNSASPLAGNLLPGRKVRLRETTPTATTIWSGFLDKITPSARVAGQGLTCTLEASGPLIMMAHKEINPAGQTTKRTDQIIGVILDEAGWPAGDRDLAVGKTTIARWFAGASQRGADVAMTALREMEETELGFMLETADGKIRFEDRHYRLVTSRCVTNQATFSDGVTTLPYTEIQEDDPLRDIYNDVTAVVRNFTAGTLAVLWTLSGGEQPTLAPGETRTWWAQYPNADDTTGVQVDAWTTPDSTDITVTGVAFASLGIAVSKFSNKMKIAITNNGTATATLTLIRARGTPVTMDDSGWVQAEDSASQTKYGKHSYQLPGKWYDDTGQAQDASNYIISRFKDPLAVLRMRFAAGKNATLQAQALGRDISDKITVTASSARSQMGIASQEFYIESIHHWIGPGALSHTCEFTLSPVGGDGAYWIVGTGVLGTTTKLGF